jgi:hypothetical protein
VGEGRKRKPKGRKRKEKSDIFLPFLSPWVAARAVATVDGERRRLRIFARQERRSYEALAEAIEAATAAGAAAEARRNDVAKFFGPEVVDFARSVQG